MFLQKHVMCFFDELNFIMKVTVSENASIRTEDKKHQIALYEQWANRRGQRRGSDHNG